MSVLVGSGSIDGGGGGGGGTGREDGDSQRGSVQPVDGHDDNKDLQKLTAPLWFLIALILSFNLICFGLFLWPRPTGSACFSEITQFNDFIYFLITTTTTVGFGDIVPAPTCVQGRIFTIAAMVTGSSSLVVLLTEILVQVDVYSSKVRLNIANEMNRSNGLHEVKSLLLLTKKSQMDLEKVQALQIVRDVGADVGEEFLGKVGVDGVSKRE